MHSATIPDCVGVGVVMACPVEILDGSPVLLEAATETVLAAAVMVLAAVELFVEEFVMAVGNAVGRFQIGRVLIFAAIVVLQTSWMSWNSATR